MAQITIAMVEVDHPRLGRVLMNEHEASLFKAELGAAVAEAKAPIKAKGKSAALPADVVAPVLPTE